MKYITAIFYNEKGSPFRKVHYHSNPHTINNEAVDFTNMKEDELRKKNKKGDEKYKDIKGRTFELDNISFDLI